MSYASRKRSHQRGRATTVSDGSGGTVKGATGRTFSKAPKTSLRPKARPKPKPKAKPRARVYSGRGDAGMPNGRNTPKGRGPGPKPKVYSGRGSPATAKPKRKVYSGRGTPSVKMTAPGTRRVGGAR